MRHADLMIALFSMGLLATPAPAEAGGVASQIRAGGYLGWTPGARRPITVGLDGSFGLAPRVEGLSVSNELYVRPELRAGRVFQLATGLRTAVGNVQSGDFGGFYRGMVAGTMVGVALRGDGRSGAHLGATAFGGYAGDGMVTLDAVVPFLGRVQGFAAPRQPQSVGSESGVANPRAYRLRRGNGPASRLFVEPTVSVGGGVNIMPAYFSDMALGRRCRQGEGSVVAPVFVLGTSSAAAARWIERGQEEAASVGVFRVLAAELAALGAPPELVGAAHRAADEEVLHALLSYGIAERMSGVTVLPLGWPSPQRLRGTRVARLERLAYESLVDGIRGEGEAARVSATLRDRVRDDMEASVEARIAEEEGGHAGLAERVLLWARAEGGASVSRVLRAA